MVAAYIGMVIVQLFWPEVLGFFQGEHPLLGKYFIRANFSQTQVQIGLFVLATLLISDKGGIDAEKGRGWLSPIELILLSAMTGAMIIAVILGYLPEANTQVLAEQSRLVHYLVQYHHLWVIAPIAALVALGFRDRKRD